MIERVIANLKRLAESKEAIILGGTCMDFTQYRTVVAELKMLRHVESEIVRVMIEGEDDEEPLDV